MFLIHTVRVVNVRVHFSDIIKGIRRDKYAWYRRLREYGEGSKVERNDRLHDSRNLGTGGWEGERNVVWDRSVVGWVYATGVAGTGRSHTCRSS